MVYYPDYVRGGAPRLRMGALLGAYNPGLFGRDLKPYLDPVRACGRYESRAHDFGFDCMEVSVFRG
jgi:hypothetical protein